MFKKATISLAVLAALGLSGCSDPYDPGQRAVGGGLLGAGAGAALGGIADGGRGAAIGALAGGGIGALGGAASTPQRSSYSQQPAYNEPSPAYYPPRRTYRY